MMTAPAPAVPVLVALLLVNVSPLDAKDPVLTVTAPPAAVPAPAVRTAWFDVNVFPLETSEALPPEARIAPPSDSAEGDPPLITAFDVNVLPLTFAKAAATSAPPMEVVFDGAPAPVAVAEFDVNVSPVRVHESWQRIAPPPAVALEETALLVNVLLLSAASAVVKMAAPIADPLAVHALPLPVA
jgi:hypothetical protein